MIEVAAAPAANTAPGAKGSNHTQAAVRAIPVPAALLLRIHPDLASILETHRGALQDSAAEGATIRIVTDPTIPPGGAVVEAPDATVDATFTAQLSEAGRRLREEPW